MPPKRKAAVATKKADTEVNEDTVGDSGSNIASKKPTKRSASKTTNSEVPKKPARKVTKSAKKAVDTIEEPVLEEPVKKVTKGRGKKAQAEKEETANVDVDNDNPKPVKRSRAKAVKDKDEATDSKKKKNTTTSLWESIDFACGRKNDEGKTYNFKISSWNIGGLKSWVKKECLQFIDNEKPDIFCMQETKCNESKLPEEIKELKGYNQYWCASQKDGYAGVGLLSKLKPIKVVYGIENDEMDQDGRCITAEFDKFYVVCVYVPNSGRGLVTLPKRLKWNDLFKDFVNTLKEKKPVIICGDMNVSHKEIDLARPKNNTKNAGFTPEEREGMTEFLEEGYIDSFRALYPDKTDVYTFWTYMANARANNVGWRLDYFLVSENLMPKICDNVIRNEVAGSDHCPITLFLNV